MGIPSIAFSQEIALGFSFARGAAFARAFVSEVLADALPPDVLLNVNLPAGEIQGVSFTRLGRRTYKQSIVEKVDPRGRKYYWIHGVPQWEKATGTDYEAVASGRISITPLHLDLTYYPGLESFGGLRDRLGQLSFPPA
jgi:5'-nucleotidase